MYIQNNKMLPDNSSLRTIKYYGCSLIATNGPNIEGKINLSGVEIPYENQYTSRITLNPESVNQPLMYGFLGNDVTFLMLKITYDETDPRCQIEEEQFIEYYFKDSPQEIRYANKLLLLTGNSQHRIPQVYLNNPSQVKVNIDVMCGNLPQSDLTIEDITTDVIQISDLYYNSILSDKIYNYTNDDNIITGSTQIQIIDNNGEVALYLDYDEISTIERDSDNQQLIINTKSDTIIYLSFLSQFELYQAHSRIEWAIEENLERHLTVDYPDVDITPPVITKNIGVDPISTGSNIYAFPINRDTETSGFTITPDDIKYYFIDSIEDNRDGSISISDAQITIRKDGEINTLTGITETGLYSIVISVTDIAKNQTILNYFILVDDVPPVINFYSEIGNTFEMKIPEDTQVPSEGITKDDVIRKTVENVIDNVDGSISKTNIELLTLGGANYIPYEPIYTPGEYSIQYIIKDSSLNESIYNKSMIVDGDIVIMSGQTFTFGESITSASFIFNGDNNGDEAYITLGNEIITIINNNNQLVWDSGRTNEYTFTSIGETYSVSYEGTVYEITFDGFGSLLFTLTRVGSAPTITNMILYQNYKEYDEDSYISEDLINFGTDYIIALDDNSGSTYNIKIKSFDYNRPVFENSEVYLENYELTFTGTTITQYYTNKYPSFNTSLLTDMLNGTLPFAELFKGDDNGYIINDLISTDNLKSIVIYGDYPKGTYDYRIELIDELGQTNIYRFKLIVN